MLRLAPGNDIRMYFGNQSAGAGILMATSDATQPIVFTSAAGTPAAGDWAGLLLLSSYGSQLSHVTIEYAGASNGWVSANCRPWGSSDNAAPSSGRYVTVLAEMLVGSRRMSSTTCAATSESRSMMR